MADKCRAMNYVEAACYLYNMGYEFVQCVQVFSKALSENVRVRVFNWLEKIYTHRASEQLL